MISLEKGIRVTVCFEIRPTIAFLFWFDEHRSGMRLNTIIKLSYGPYTLDVCLARVQDGHE